MRCELGGRRHRGPAIPRPHPPTCPSMTSTKPLVIGQPVTSMKPLVIGRVRGDEQVTSRKQVRGGQVRICRISAETINDIEELQTEKRPLFLFEQLTQNNDDNNNIRNPPYIG